MSSKHYLNNKDLYIEIIVSKAQGKLTKKAENMLILLAKNVIIKFHYYDSRDRQDCLATAYEHLFKRWYSFNELKTTNAFAFYTEVVKRVLEQGFKDIYKQEYKTGEYFDKHITFSQLFSDEKSEINF